VEALKSIMKKLSRSKDKKKSSIERKLKKRLMMFCRRQQDGSVDSVRQESQLYIAEDNKDADGSVDSVRRREPIICTLT
jgi:hypothetical protein